eukprot:scaffold5604_cov78-Phaeocystis_antarctica.AAC.1
MSASLLLVRVKRAHLRRVEPAEAETIQLRVARRCFERDHHRAGVVVPHRAHPYLLGCLPLRLHLVRLLCGLGQLASRRSLLACSARAAATTASTTARCALILRVAATAWRTFAPRQCASMHVAAPTRAFISTVSAAFCRARLLLWYVFCAPSAPSPLTRRATSVTVALSITVGSAANASCGANMGAESRGAHMHIPARRSARGRAACRSSALDGLAISA